MDCNNCDQLGFSEGHKVCGYFLQGGEICYVHDGKISEPCPKVAWEQYNKLVKEGKIKPDKTARQSEQINNTGK